MPDSPRLFSRVRTEGELAVIIAMLPKYVSNGVSSELCQDTPPILTFEGDDKVDVSFEVTIRKITKEPS